MMEKGQKQQDAQQQQQGLQVSAPSREQVQQRAEALAREVLVQGLREAAAGAKPGRRGGCRHGGVEGAGADADGDADASGGDGGGPEPRPHQVEAVAALLCAVYWDPLDAPASSSATSAASSGPAASGPAASGPASSGPAASGPATDAPPVNYLLQHSTGSGKSFTIAALATALAGWRDGAGGGFGTVLVLNDRLQLDVQLGGCVEAFWRGNGRPPGGLRRATTTRELAGFLAAPPGSPGRPAVVLTTVQKLATLWRARGGRVGGGSGGGGGGRGKAAASGGEALLSRIAVIADEAHRHHGHGTTDQIHQILAGALAAGGVGGGEAAAGAAPGRGPAAAAGVGAGGSSGHSKLRPQQRRQPRGVTYVGFTATPSPKALELFGVATEVPADPTAPDGDAAAAGGRGDGGIEALLLEGDGAGAGAGAGGGSRGTGAEPPAMLYTPYHAYTMRNAIQDGFVLDVLRSYTAVTPRLQLAARREGAAGVDQEAKAQEAGGAEGAEEAEGNAKGGAGEVEDGGGGGPGVAEEVLVEAASNSREVVERKAAYIVQRFLALWRTASAAGYSCLRGMVVARSRQHVAWYTQALRQAVSQEPEFARLAEAAAAADPSDAASSCRGPSVYGAFSGAVQLPAAELAALRRRLNQQQLERWRRWQAGADWGQGVEDVDVAGSAAGGDGDGGEDGRQRRPSKRRRQDPGPVSAWDAALAHLDGVEEDAAGEEEKRATKQQRQQHQQQRRRRGTVKSDSEELEAGHDWEAEEECSDSDSAGSASDGTPSDGDSEYELNEEEEEEEEEESEEGDGSDSAEEDEEEEDCGKQRCGGPRGRRGHGRVGRASQAEDDPGGSNGSDGDGGGGDGSSDLEGGGGGAARKRPRREDSALTPGAQGDGLSGRSSGAAAAPGGAGGGAGGGMSVSMFGPPDSSVTTGPVTAGPAAAAAAAAARTASAGVRRQASRLTVTSRAAVPAPDGVEAADVAVAGAGACGGDESGPAATIEAGPDSGLGGCSTPLRPRRLTRASSSTAVAGPLEQRRQQRLGTDEELADADDEDEVAEAQEEEVVMVPVTEAELNGSGAGGGGRGAADPRAARLLVVCSKYETGYDDPRLGALFIDRTLTGSRAVQVLGRLNRPAPSLGKAPGLLGVVDFVNGVGGLREAFEEFYDVTYLHTGKHARRLRQERQMERALCRILEALQPAADRAAAAAAAAAATVTGGGNSGSGNLMAMGVREIAAAAGAHLPPEVRRALESDLSVYTALAGSLRLELPELPHVFAAALLARLTADREARERQAAALGLAAAAAAAGGGADAEEAGGGAGAGAAAIALSAVQVAVCELEETFSGAICLAGPSPLGLLPTAAVAAGAEGTPADGVEAGAQAATTLAGTEHGIVLGGRGFLAASLARGSSRSKSSGGSGNASGAPATTGGSTALSRFGLAAAAAAPLRGRPIGGGGSSRRGGKIGRGGGSSTGDPRNALDRKVRKNRPISEVIAAANAALDGAYERRLAAGFRDICARLAAANAAAAAAATATATATEAANGGPATAAASAGAAAATADSYELLSLLRRLSMWPVGVEQLKATAVGREVAALKKHECPQVANLARTLIARWKAVAASHAAATAAAAAGSANGGAAQDGRKPVDGGVKAQRAGSATPSGGAAAAAAAAAAPAIDEGLRTRARAMLTDALKAHATAAAAAAAAKAAKARARDGAAAAPLAPPLLPVESERLAEAARALEDAVFGVHGREGAAYKSQTRALVAALRHADGVARGLLAGSTAAAELAAADSMALAPPRVRAQAEELERKKRLEMEAWEKLAGQGAGGASTYKSAGTICPGCGGAGATVHNVLSGGTYAQERVQIQKFVCDHCGSTWRND